MDTKERKVLAGKLWILLFAVAMVFVMISLPAHAEESEIAAISFDPGKDITLTEYVDGYYIFDDVNGWYFNYEYQVTDVPGTKLTVTGKDGVSTIYTCVRDEDTDTEVYVSESGDTIQPYSLGTYDEQWKDHWTEGVNYITITYMDADCQIPVYIEENPIVSIRFDPVKDLTVIENVTGFYSGDYGEEEYFIYDHPNPFIEGSRLTLTDKDGASTEYTCIRDKGVTVYISESGDRVAINCINSFDDQFEHHWIKDGENYITILCMGVECQVPVYITDNPIASISYERGEDLTLIENRDGYSNWDDEYGDYFQYEYGDALFAPGARLTLTGKDGLSTVYTCLYDEKTEEYEFESESGDRLDRYYLYVSDDQLRHHWTKGVNYVTIRYLGIECQTPVYIVDNPIVSIRFDRGKEITLKEYLDGIYVRTDAGDKYFEYQYPYLFIEGSKLILTDRNGISTEYTCVEEEFDNVFISESGDRIHAFSLSCSDGQDKKHWTAGGENYITITYQGLSCRVPVAIVENPVLSISYTPSRMPVFIEGENIWTSPEDWGRYIFTIFPDLPYPGDTLVINYKGGNSRTYIYDSGFVNVSDASDVINDNELRFEPEYDYWKYGTDNYLTVTYNGIRTNIKVSFKKDNKPEIPSTGITVASKKLYLKKGDSYKISYILKPLESTDKVTFTSSKKKVATVSSTGTIKAKGKGTANITVKTESGKKVVIKVNVAKKATRTKKVTVAKKRTLKVGDVKFISYKRKPSNTTDKVTFKSSKKSVVTVDSNGKLIAKKKGTAKITIKSGKKKAVCKITVK